MSMRILSILLATVLTGCTASVPDDLARTVLLEELPLEEGIFHDGFLACVAVDDRDANAKLLAALRDAHIDAVPASECQWDPAGSYHRVSRRKALLVNVHGYKRAGTVEFETSHHMKYATRKTLEVARGSSGWKIVRTQNYEMATADEGRAREARA